MALSANSIGESYGAPKSLSTIFDLIRTSPDLKEKVERIRSFHGDEQKQKALKKATLQWFSLGEYKNRHRSNSDLISIRFLIHDLDDVKTDLTKLRSKLRDIPSHRSMSYWTLKLSWTPVPINVDCWQAERIWLSAPVCFTLACQIWTGRSSPAQSIPIPWSLACC